MQNDLRELQKSADVFMSIIYSATIAFLVQSTIIWVADSFYFLAVFFLFILHLSSDWLSRIRLSVVLVEHFKLRQLLIKFFLEVLLVSTIALAFLHTIKTGVRFFPTGQLENCQPTRELETALFLYSAAAFLSTLSNYTVVCWMSEIGLSDIWKVSFGNYENLPGGIEKRLTPWFKSVIDNAVQKITDENDIASRLWARLKLFLAALVSTAIVFQMFIGFLIIALALLVGAYFGDADQSLSSKTFGLDIDLFSFLIRYYWILIILICILIILLLKLENLSRIIQIYYIALILILFCIYFFTSVTSVMAIFVFSQLLLSIFLVLLVSGSNEVARNSNGGA